MNVLEPLKVIAKQEFWFSVPKIVASFLRYWAHCAEFGYYQITNTNDLYILRSFLLLLTKMTFFESWLEMLGCETFAEMYLMIQDIAKYRMGIHQLPFSLADLESENPSLEIAKDVSSFIVRCSKFASGDNSEKKLMKLIKSLKESPPEVTYESPKLPEGVCTKKEGDFMNHIFQFGMELPGSKHNLFGMGYFTEFFYDMYFGNFTEFMAHVNRLTSSGELKKALKKREGYNQFSPIFAPVMGLRVVDMEDNPLFTSSEVREIRLLYNGSNEDKHLNILKKLLKLKVDPNAHDRDGFTALHYAIYFMNIQMVQVLLKHGANPNAESRFGVRPLTIQKNSQEEEDMVIIDALLQHNAKLKDKKHINELRDFVEKHGSKGLAVRVREAMPREKEECEHCSKSAEKKCSACGAVFYCSSTCQKMDWKFHKITCQN